MLGEGRRQDLGELQGKQAREFQTCGFVSKHGRAHLYRIPRTASKGIEGVGVVVSNERKRSCPGDAPRIFSI